MRRCNRFLRALLLPVLVGWCSSSSAVQIETTESRIEDGGTRYHFVISSWTDGGGRFCDDMTAATCGLSIMGAQRPGDYAYLVSSQYHWKIKPSPTMNGVLSQMDGFRIPFKGSIFVPKGTPVSDQFCITFTHGYSYANEGSLVVPVGPCARVKTPALQCDIKGNTLLDHHVVFDDAINGNEAETQLQLTCSGISQVKATAATEDPKGIKLKADGSLYSVLSINGKPASDGVKVNVEPGLITYINLKSTLAQKGQVEPGPFSGSTVLTISPP